MLEISLAYKDWLFIGVQNQKTRKMLKKLKKIARLAVARGVFGTAKKVGPT